MAFLRLALAAMVAAGLTACTTFEELTGTGFEQAPSEGISRDELQSAEYPEYVIGPYDQLQIFVWRSEELSTTVAVRPDGRISTPLISDMIAAGKSPTQLASDIEQELREYVRSPDVTVIVQGFSSTFDQQVRILGEAQQPSAIPYQAGMTTLDVMISVGGLTEFAAGNRAKLIRNRGGAKETYRLRLGDLLRNGDVTADVPLQPGDVILIPESLF
ncbi:XrtA/PEP-CTERM system exopolysaccharide export protein [Parvularcula maris]|uniref:Polysaccharide export protein n=1 Tax=Parvularcula maris TaxID=2965077 RepID=A0A9X2L8E2_9PROT|nr:XrtA/PEP-CTERM system exopolysaccharide export protein [Parvularcula maris]MCQ8185014.1 polysaccharide export protein [Parvularcula maris]